MNTIMLASIIAGVILLLFIITAGTYYKLFSNNYTNILCGSYLFKDDFNSYMSNTKLPLSKTGNKYTYTLWINIQNIPENSQWILIEIGCHFPSKCVPSIVPAQKS